MRRVSVIVVVLAGCGPTSLPHEGKSVEQLRRLLDRDDPTSQAQAALGLSLHGPAAAAAVPRLVERLSSTDALVRQRAALALGKMGGPDAIGPLSAALADREWPVRRQAALALGELGEPARAAVPALKKRLADDSLPVRRAAQQALERLRPAK